MIVFVAEKEEIHQAALHNLKDHNFSIYFQDKFEKIRGKVDVLFIKTYTKADKAYLANFPNLKFLLRAGVGLDNVDREECERRKIKIFNFRETLCVTGKKEKFCKEKRDRGRLF